MTTDHDVAGPVDFVLLEFDDPTASTARPPPPCSTSSTRGIVTVLDLLVIAKDADGTFSGLEIEDLTAEPSAASPPSPAPARACSATTTSPTPPRPSRPAPSVP